MCKASYLVACFSVFAVACSNSGSVEDLESVYRASKALEAAVSGGTTMMAHRDLRTKLETEILIAADLWRAQPSKEAALKPIVQAYHKVANAHKAAEAIWELRSTLDSCNAQHGTAECSKMHAGAILVHHAVLESFGVKAATVQDAWQIAGELRKLADEQYLALKN